MLDKKNLVALAKATAKALPGNTYNYSGESMTYEQLNETLRKEFNEYAATYSLYRANRNLIFEVLEETFDEILPKRLELQYGQFAEVKTFAQGDKPMFKRKLAGRKTRAKQFITRVGLAGIYEVFKLGYAESESFEVRTSAIGGAAQIGFEEFLDGRVDFAEVMAIVIEGMDELIYKEIGYALKAAVWQLPTQNIAVVNGFDEVEFDRLLALAAAYGEPTIYCTEEFAVKMIPQEAWRYTEAMKDELYKTGRLAGYKGRKVIILENGFEDETCTKKVIDPGYCWIMPNGYDNKPVKVALEGGTIIDEFQNPGDRSREIQVYKKVGVVAMMANNICAYLDTTLLGQMGQFTFKDTVQNVVHVANYGEGGFITASANAGSDVVAPDAEGSGSLGD